MKKYLFVLLLPFLLTFISCSSNRLPSGAWQLVRSESVTNGKTTVNYPGKMVGSEYKFWSEKNFMFVGRWTRDSVSTDNYGFGEYTLEGKDYQETVLRHFRKEYQGQKIRMTLEMSRDTIIQVYHPYDSTGRQMTEISSVEKYVRIR